jgi:myo-inositol-1(or 4)-monophosphatase
VEKLPVLASTGATDGEQTAQTAPTALADDALELPALVHREPAPGPNIVAAVVFLPYLDETYLAVRGGGAYLNSRSIRLAVSPIRELADGLVATGFAYERERYPNYDNFVRVARKARGIRRCGAAAIDLAFVAAGRYEAFWELGLRPHDVAAGALLVQEAGGRVEDLSGGTDWLDGGNIIATNGLVHEAMRELLDPFEPPGPAD